MVFDGKETVPREGVTLELGQSRKRRNISQVSAQEVSVRTNYSSNKRKSSVGTTRVEVHVTGIKINKKNVHFSYKKITGPGLNSINGSLNKKLRKKQKECRDNKMTVYEDQLNDLYHKTSTILHTDVPK